MAFITAQNSGHMPIALNTAHIVDAVIFDGGLPGELLVITLSNGTQHQINGEHVDNVWQMLKDGPSSEGGGGAFPDLAGS